MVLKGVTKSGFEFEINKDALDDMELFEQLAEIDNGAVSVLPRVVERLLGKEQKNALYDFYRDEKTGIVKASVIFDVFKEIFNASEDAKKS